MKRLFLGIYLLFTISLTAQERDTVWLYHPSEEERIAWLRLVDSLTHPDAPPFDPLDEEQRLLRAELQLRPVVPLASLYRIVRPIGRSGRIVVINNAVLLLGRRVALTNGQAGLWAPYPMGYQDARTLSVPLP